MDATFHTNNEMGSQKDSHFEHLTLSISGLASLSRSFWATLLRENDYFVPETRFRRIDNPQPNLATTLDFT